MKRVLIANRGEIAVRVIRACRESGLSPVAVHSTADRKALHTILADASVELGAAPASESYLSIEKILDAARATGSDAVHPGYGFLSENAEFAHAVEAAGLVFVGPPANAIAAMADKTEARSRMAAAGVPVVPGTPPVESVEEAIEGAKEVGMPVLLKAVAGGGGKGMHLVEALDDVPSAFVRASSEASGAFGDSRVYVERFLREPRHIEIQILADGERIVALGERECSIQRRHQKLIEEAPAVGLDEGLRRRMGEVAVRAAEAVGYRGAGTVEFLLEGDDFFFLEMNTRIQVEHPVTEYVTGVDLVREQLTIAGGGRLLGGREVPVTRGHAIECRISAEAPAGGFLPSAGTISAVAVPEGPGVRWDGGIRSGDEVGLHYDPLLGKLVVHAEDRAAAIQRMRRALQALHIEGVDTTTEFHLAVMEEPDYRANRISIRYVEEHPDLMPTVTAEDRRIAIAAAVLLQDRRDAAWHAPSSAADDRSNVALSPWVLAGSIR